VSSCSDSTHGSLAGFLNWLWFYRFPAGIFALKTWTLSIVSSSTFGSHSGTVEIYILRLRYEFISICHIKLH
jgi:hypothetical protein